MGASPDTSSERALSEPGVGVWTPSNDLAQSRRRASVGHGSAWVPMGCAQTFVMRLPDDYHQATHDALAHRPRSACGSRRSLAVAPLIGNQRCYGETPMSLRRDCRPIRRNGPDGWRWVRGQRLAIWGSQPGLGLSAETPATGEGARPVRSLATPTFLSGGEICGGL